MTAATDRLQAIIDRHGYLSWLGFELDVFEPGRAVMTVPYDADRSNTAPGSRGSTHGGVVATLIDTASAFALRTSFDDPAAAAMTTIDLRVSYLRPATAALRADAEVVRAGGTIGVADVSVATDPADGDPEEVAVGGATYRLFRDRT